MESNNLINFLNDFYKNKNNEKNKKITCKKLLSLVKKDKSMTDDASKLLVYTPIPRDGSTLTLHYGQPTTGLDEEVATWHDELKEPKFSEDFEDNDSDVDFNMDVGTNSNIGLLTKTYAITENQLQQIH